MILSVMLVFSTQITAFAYTDTSAETSVSEEKESETEEVLEETETAEASEEQTLDEFVYGDVQTFGDEE